MKDNLTDADRLRYLEAALEASTLDKEKTAKERDKAVKDLEKAEKEREKAEKEREKAEKEREKAVKDLAKAEKEREKERDKAGKDLAKAVARENLLSSFCFDSLSELLSLIVKCDLDSVPKVYITNYMTVERDADTSLTFANENKSSVTASESTQDILRLNTMRRRMTYATSSKILVKELNLSGLDNELCRALFKNEKAAFDEFVKTHSAILDKLRNALYYIGNLRRIQEVDELQPYATLLLEEFVRIFHSNAVVLPGQSVPLKGVLVVGEDADTAVTKTIRGFTDLIVHETNSDADDASKAICILELKTPKGKLYHSAASAAKDQLLFEMEILGQMGCKPSMVMGGLTDLFAIAVAVRKVVDGVCIFYVSDRVTGLQEFIKRLLLLLCRDQDSVWEILLGQSTDEVSVEEEEEEEEEEVRQDDGGYGEGAHGYVDGDDTSGGEPRKGKENVFSDTAGAVPGEHPTSLSFAKEAVVALSKLRVVDRLEEYNEAVSRLLSWDNRRKGLATLTSDALNKMNAEHSKS